MELTMDLETPLTEFFGLGEPATRVVEDDVDRLPFLSLLRDVEELKTHLYNANAECRHLHKTLRKSKSRNRELEHSLGRAQAAADAAERRLAALTRRRDEAEERVGGGEGATAAAAAAAAAAGSAAGANGEASNFSSRFGVKRNGEVAAGQRAKSPTPSARFLDDTAGQRAKSPTPSARLAGSLASREFSTPTKASSSGARHRVDSDGQPWSAGRAAARAARQQQRRQEQHESGRRRSGERVERVLGRRVPRQHGGRGAHSERELEKASGTGGSSSFFSMARRAMSVSFFGSGGGGDKRRGDVGQQHQQRSSLALSASPRRPASAAASSSSEGSRVTALSSSRANSSAGPTLLSPSPSLSAAQAMTPWDSGEVNGMATGSRNSRSLLGRMLSSSSSSSSSVLEREVERLTLEVSRLKRENNRLVRAKGVAERTETKLKSRNGRGATAAATGERVRRAQRGGIDKENQRPVEVDDEEEEEDDDEEEEEEEEDDDEEEEVRRVLLFSEQQQQQQQRERGAWNAAMPTMASFDDSDVSVTV